MRLRKFPELSKYGGWVLNRVCVCYPRQTVVRADAGKVGATHGRCPALVAQIVAQQAVMPPASAADRLLLEFEADSDASWPASSRCAPAAVTSVSSNRSCHRRLHTGQTSGSAASAMAIVPPHGQHNSNGPINRAEGRRIGSADSATIAPKHGAGHVASRPAVLGGYSVITAPPPARRPRYGCRPASP